MNSKKDKKDKRNGRKRPDILYLLGNLEEVDISFLDHSHFSVFLIVVTAFLSDEQEDR